MGLCCSKSDSSIDTSTRSDRNVSYRDGRVSPANHTSVNTGNNAYQTPVYTAVQMSHSPSPKEKLPSAVANAIQKYVTDTVDAKEIEVYNANRINYVKLSNSMVKQMQEIDAAVRRDSFADEYINDLYKKAETLNKVSYDFEDVAKQCLEAQKMSQHIAYLLESEEYSYAYIQRYKHLIDDVSLTAINDARMINVSDKRLIDLSAMTARVEFGIMNDLLNKADRCIDQLGVFLEKRADMARKVRETDEDLFKV